MAPRLQRLAMARRVSPALLFVSLSCWLALGATSLELPSVPLCSPSQTPVTAGLAFATLHGVAATGAFAAVLWVFMVVAMTAPLLARPIAQLRLHSPAERRDRATVLFVGAHLLVWIAIGPLMLAAPEAIDTLAGATGLPSIAIAVASATLWQAAPLRQRALNRCHCAPHRPSSGSAVDRDCIAFGLTHGAWCAATCLPLMVLTLMVPSLHLALMFLLSLAIQLERLAPAQAPSWTFRILPGQSAAVVLFRSIRWSTR